MTIDRVRALSILGVLVLIAGILAAWAIIRDSRPDVTHRSCADGAIPVATSIPEQKNITIKVYNTTDQPGLAKNTAGELQRRGFHVRDVGDDPKKRSVHGTAELWYGPQGLGAAHLLRAYILDTKMVFDRDRTDDNVEVVLGTGFQQLNTPTEVNQAIQANGEPSRPPGTC